MINVFITDENPRHKVTLELDKPFQEYLRELGYDSIKIKGVYDGVEETSYMVPMVGLGQRLELFGISQRLGQDSIMIQSPKECRLWLHNGNSMVLGGPLMKSFRKPKGDHSVINGNYYVIRE